MFGSPSRPSILCIRVPLQQNTKCFLISLEHKPLSDRDGPLSGKNLDKSGKERFTISSFFIGKRCCDFCDEKSTFFPMLRHFLCFVRHMIFITSPLTPLLSSSPPLSPSVVSSFLLSLSVFCCGRFFLCFVSLLRCCRWLLRCCCVVSAGAGGGV